jgi:hypothetical protein
MPIGSMASSLLSGPGTRAVAKSVSKMPGRPRRAGGADERIELRVTAAERAAWEREAKRAEQPLGAWIRSRCSDGVATRIVVEPDGDDEWFWTAFDRHGNELGAGNAERHDKRSVLHVVEGVHGLRVDEDVSIDVIAH